MKSPILAALLVSLPVVAFGQAVDPCRHSKAELAPVLPVVVIEGHRPANQRSSGAEVSPKSVQPIEGPLEPDAQTPEPESASVERLLYQTRNDVAQLKRDLSQLRAEVRQLHRFQILHPSLPTLAKPVRSATSNTD